MRLILEVEVSDTFASIPAKAQKVVKKKMQDVLQEELRKLQIIEDEKYPDEKAFNDAVRSPGMREKFSNLADLLKKKGV